MQDLFFSELSAYSLLELAAVALAVAYIVLAARNHRFCWIAAFISSAIFVVVLWNAQLLMDAALNAYYVAMAVYGWISWTGSRSKQVLSISHWALKHHMIACTAVVTLSAISGTLLSHYTDAAFPYLDSFTTWGSFLATWMLARRIIENWLYWIVFDSIAIYLYYQKDLHFTMVLFAIYVIMSIYALFYWQKISRESTTTAAH